ncbi:MAG: stage II sporulation protein M [Candidatus Pacearchaeota archaeon]
MKETNKQIDRIKRKIKIAIKEDILKYKNFLKFISESRVFIFIVLSFFVFSMIVGFIYPEMCQDFLLKLIKEILEKTQDLNFPQLLSFIIYNNLKTSLLGILLGLFFGIFPIFLAALNGYLLGFVFSEIYKDNKISEAWRILPHGIFELPAFLLSLGLGLMLGYTLFFKSHRFRYNFLMTLKIFIYIILPLLLIAGIIETSLIFLLK